MPELQRRHVALALLALVVAVTACRTAEKWVGGEPVRDSTLASLFGVDPDETSRDPSTIPEVEVRRHLRPCCAFGAGLKVAMGPVPGPPGFKVANITGVDELGPHNYDNPVAAIEPRDIGTRPVINERNGLIYTCHGGFIDTAHVRDYADWTLFLWRCCTAELL